MFLSSTIIRELALSLAKVIFMLKHHSVKLRRYLLLRLCGRVLPSRSGITVSPGMEECHS